MRAALADASGDKIEAAYARRPRTYKTPDARGRMGGVLRISVEAPDEDVAVTLRSEAIKGGRLCNPVLREAGLGAAALESFIRSGAVGRLTN